MLICKIILAIVAAGAALLWATMFASPRRGGVDGAKDLAVRILVACFALGIPIFWFVYHNTSNEIDQRRSEEAPKIMAGFENGVRNEIMMTALGAASYDLTQDQILKARSALAQSGYPLPADGHEAEWMRSMKDVSNDRLKALCAQAGVPYVNDDEQAFARKGGL